MIKTVDSAIRVLDEVKAILKLNVSDAKYKVYEEEIINIMELLKKLKIENLAYIDMWNELYEKIGNYGWELRDQDGLEIMYKIIKRIERKYIGDEK
jgi:hypothetical protein